MKTRMSKYYRSDSGVKNRSARNQDLYRTIYDEGEYSNIEGIVNIAKTDEIDLDKIKKLLENLESQNNPPKRQQIVREVEPIPAVSDDFVEAEEKKYDIRDILNRAKDERAEVQNDFRSLDATQYNILKNLKLDDKFNEKDYLKDEEGLLELIHTITNTSMLNKLGDRDLSLNLLSSLQSSDDTVVHEPIQMNKITEECQKVTKQVNDDKIDRSFFTSSLNFNEEDFEQLKDINKSLKKNNFVIKLLSFILFVAMMAVILYIAYTLFKP